MSSSVPESCRPHEIGVGIHRRLVDLAAHAAGVDLFFGGFEGDLHVLEGGDALRFGERLLEQSDIERLDRRHPLQRFFVGDGEAPVVARPLRGLAVELVGHGREHSLDGLGVVGKRHSGQAPRRFAGAGLRSLVAVTAPHDRRREQQQRCRASQKSRTVRHLGDATDSGARAKGSNVLEVVSARRRRVRSGGTAMVGGWDRLA